MIRLWILAAGLLLELIVFKSIVYAAHPLITDDSVTQGKGNAQLEFIGEFNRETEHEVTSETLTFPTIPVLSYGLTKNVDLVLGVPFQSVSINRAGITTKESGISDASLQIKWRFLENRFISLAIKPGVTVPTGDEKKGLGNGALCPSVYFITTKELAKFTLHINAGLMRNDYGSPEDEQVKRRYAWHLSAAVEIPVKKGVKTVANVGMNRNSDRNSNTDPAFILGGIIYSLSPQLDADFGVKRGINLNRTRSEISYLAGFTFRM